jgi:uncharacterized protein (DUF885 family)
MPQLTSRVAFVCFCLALAFHSRAQPVPRDQSLSPMRDIIERFTADEEALERCYPIRISDARRQRLAGFYSDQLKKLDKVDFEKLDRPGKVDYLLLKNAIDFDVKQLEHVRKHFAEIAPMLPFSQGIISLEEARRRLDPMDGEKTAKALAQIDKQVADAKKACDTILKSSADAQSRVLAARAARTINSLLRVLREWDTFYDGYDPQFTWWMKQTYPKVEKDLQDYSAYLRKRGGDEGDDDPVIGDPIGREALIDALKAEMIPYSPEELIEIANREFEWCDKEMKRAATDLGFDGDWHKALEHVNSMHVKPGEQPALIKRLAEEATKFVEDRDLVTVPPLCKEIWRMEMMTPQRQRVNPYFTGGEIISITFPTDDMTFEDKEMSMRGNNPAFCHATVFHELIPGHHLQLFMSERYSAHRRIFRTPFLVEGWALYWEMRMWDLGFHTTPEERVGALFWRAHRCARIIFSLKFHLGQMTAPQAIDFLVTRVGHERRNATAEVRRSVNGSYGPLYQAAYMLGGLQLRALHKEMVESKNMTEREFHDQILHENAIPIEMIRGSMGGENLNQDFKSTWKFYGEMEGAR